MSDYQHFVDAVRRAMPRLLLISVIAALVALLITRSFGQTHQMHFSYLVSLSDREGATEFRFDGYYALSATDLFTATLAEWVTTPEVVVAAFGEAVLPLPSRDPAQVGRAVSAEKTAPQLVEVTVRHEDEQVVRRLTDGLMKVMEENVARYHAEGIPAAQFQVVATEPWLGTRQLSVPVIVVATGVFVFFFAVNGVLLLESLKRIKEEE